MNNTNNQTARESYRIAIGLLYNAMRNKFPTASNPDKSQQSGDDECMAWVQSRKLSQSEIRLEVQLNAANNIFKFGMTAKQPNSQAVQYITEQRLEEQDTLICSEYGIYVANPASLTDTNFQLFTHGNPIAFTAAQAASIDGTFFMNGKYIIRVNNDVIAPYRQLNNHFYRGQTQQTAAIGAGSPQDQLRLAEDGLITQEPNLLLVGSKAYVPQIELLSNMADVAEGTRAVLIYKGILAQNSTVIN